MLLDCFASLRSSFCLYSFFCVLSSLHWAKYVFLKILTFVKSSINQHFKRQTKIF